MNRLTSIKYYFYPVLLFLPVYVSIYFNIITKLKKIILIPSIANQTTIDSPVSDSILLHN